MLILKLYLDCKMNPELILVNPSYDEHIALIQINRPKELNALNLQVMGEIRDALKALDDDDNVRVIIITGNERAFAAGADIKQMAGKNAIDMLKIDAKYLFFQDYKVRWSDGTFASNSSRLVGDIFGSASPAFSNACASDAKAKPSSVRP